MSAQDARIADAVNDGVGVALGALEEVIGVPVVPAFRREIEKATAKGIKATLDALGFETGHVIITGEPGAVVGFKVLPPDPG